MAPRRKKPKANGLTGPEKRDGELYFSRHDLLKLMLAEERVQARSAQVTQLNSYVAQLRAESEVRVRDVLKRRDEVAIELNKKLGELGTLKRSIEESYSINLEGVTFDDETGLITLSDKE